MHRPQRTPWFLHEIVCRHVVASHALSFVLHVFNAAYLRHGNVRAFELWGIIAFNYGVGLQRELYYVHRLSLVCASAQFGLYHMMCVRAER